MNTKDPTLNVNLLLEQMTGCIDLTQQNAQHYNDREITANLADVQKRYVNLMKNEMYPSENSIRVVLDAEKVEKQGK
ncbi:hypothetical protein NX722_05525 [Endozoicomonas gorgoniicola]|uniref:Uncharacterized protein n=1 Tax=Endozoicomonas gorgoniicola TaxID=1234144 RepID=A0ABT3MRV3_9GAMM|nr:hypothetical protein [Endozoicomonas gorgoniicola]MCW7552112.1 hypothetical protein [Endozoicomonas gorgoniicola]